MHWSIAKNDLCFKLKLKVRKITRKGMPSTLSSFYGSLDLATFILRGRKISQDQKNTKLNRNARIIISLGTIKFKRCIESGAFGTIVHLSLHSFSDASELGDGESSYLRLNTDTYIAP